MYLTVEIVWSSISQNHLNELSSRETKQIWLELCPLSPFTSQFNTQPKHIFNAESDPVGPNHQPWRTALLRFSPQARYPPMQEFHIVRVHKLQTGQKFPICNKSKRNCGYSQLTLEMTEASISICFPDSLLLLSWTSQFPWGGRWIQQLHW